MSWADYQPGRRVVCVADWSGTLAVDICTVLPVKGRVYTIRATSVADGLREKNILGLRFVEFQSFTKEGSPYLARDGEWWWQAFGFRPLDETRLDVFRKMLAPSRQGVVA